jgi:hypothetical protein
VRKAGGGVRRGGGGETVDVAGDVERCTTDSCRASPGLQPVALHGGDQAQSCVGHLMHLLAKVESVSKAMQKEAGVHRPALGKFAKV